MSDLGMGEELCYLARFICAYFYWLVSLVVFSFLFLWAMMNLYDQDASVCGEFVLVGHLTFHDKDFE